LNNAQILAQEVFSRIDQVVIGKQVAKKLFLASLLARGHVLLEGPPGIAKTLLVRCFAQVFQLSFKRIQFTPDIMPSDITGANVFNPKSAEFTFVPGPLFAHFVLADEINRAPAKTQSALLEAMQERQVSVDNTTYMLQDPFIVCATQNPLDYEGTYALPEAQLDRFMVRILMDYPDARQERLILAGAEYDPRSISPLKDASQLIASAQQSCDAVVVDERIYDYVQRLLSATREHEQISIGASPRAGKMFIRLCKSYCALDGKGFITPDDIQQVVPFALAHRLIRKPDAEIEGISGEEIIASLFESVTIEQ